MKSQALIQILTVILLIAVVAAVGITLSSFVPVPDLLATVSWNG